MEAEALLPQSAQKNSCSCQVVSCVVIDLRSKVTETLVKMQSGTGRASVKVHRVAVQFCDYRTREEVDQSGPLQNTCLDVQVRYPKSTACSLTPRPFEPSSLRRDFMFMLPTSLGRGLGRGFVREGKLGQKAKPSTMIKVVFGF